MQDPSSTTAFEQFNQSRNQLTDPQSIVNKFQLLCLQTSPLGHIPSIVHDQLSQEPFQIVYHEQSQQTNQQSSQK